MMKIPFYNVFCVIPLLNHNFFYYFLWEKNKMKNTKKVLFVKPFLLKLGLSFLSRFMRKTKRIIFFRTNLDEEIANNNKSIFHTRRSKRRRNNTLNILYIKEKNEEIIIMYSNWRIAEWWDGKGIKRVKRQFMMIKLQFYWR